MRTIDLLKLALINLSRRKSRTFLTVLGVIVGTACIVLMFSIGYSNMKQFSNMLEDNERLTQIQIQDYSSSTRSGRGGVTDSTIQSIAALDHIKAASPVIKIPVTIKTGAYEANTQITGIDPAVLSLDFAEGGIFQTGSSMPSLVIGSEAQKQFIDPKNPPNYADYAEYSKYAPDIDWMNTEMEMQIGFQSDDPEVPVGTITRTSVAGLLKPAQSNQSGNIYILTLRLLNEF